MGLDALLARLEGEAVTPDTASVLPDVTPKPAPVRACTPVTSVTAQSDDVVEAVALTPPSGPTKDGPSPADSAAKGRKARALAFLDAHPNVRRACFADVNTDPANVILTVAVREPRGAVEVLVRRDKFDAVALMDLSLRYPGTSLSIPEH